MSNPNNLNNFKSNFEFLKSIPNFPQPIIEQAMKAEKRYLDKEYDDAGTAIRQTSEYITQYLLHKAGITDLEQSLQNPSKPNETISLETLYGRIAYLEHLNCVDSSLIDAFHKIRAYGNRGTHVDLFKKKTISPKEIYYGIKTTRYITIQFAQTFLPMGKKANAPLFKLDPQFDKQPDNDKNQNKKQKHEQNEQIRQNQAELEKLKKQLAQMESELENTIKAKNIAQQNLYDRQNIISDKNQKILDLERQIKLANTNHNQTQINQLQRELEKTKNELQSAIGLKNIAVRNSDEKTETISQKNQTIKELERKIRQLQEQNTQRTTYSSSSTQSYHSNSIDWRNKIGDIIETIIEIVRSILPFAILAGIVAGVLYIVWKILAFGYDFFTREKTPTPSETTTLSAQSNNTNNIIDGVMNNRPPLKYVDAKKLPTTTLMNEYANDKVAQYELGKRFYLAKNPSYDQAITWFTKSAEQDYPYAQNYLGEIYQTGKGVTVDYAKAVEWYTKAANQDVTIAQYRLAKLYDFGYSDVKQDYDLAFKWFFKAAQSNHVSSQSNLARYYYDGLGTEKNYTKAIQMYQNAINNTKLGNEISDENKNKAISITYLQNSIAQIYESGGYGVTQDIQKALSWYKKIQSLNDKFDISPDEFINKKIIELTQRINQQKQSELQPLNSNSNFNSNSNSNLTPKYEIKPNNPNRINTKPSTRKDPNLDVLL